MSVTNYKLQTTNYRGFTLIEVVVAIFIFLIIMMSVSQIFISAFRGYNYAKMVQRDVETAQFTINMLAKELRTSSVVDFDSTSVQFVDYSQDICFKYRISGGDLQIAKKKEIKTFAMCQVTSFGSGDFATISTGAITGNFSVIPSTQSPQKIGKVTISFVINEGVPHLARIQTTASLRDFGYTAL